MIDSMRSTGFQALAALVLLASLGRVSADEPHTYGKGVGAGETVTIGQVLGEPDRYVGKTIRVSGRITDVCPMAGCWIDIADGKGKKAKQIRFKVWDPLESTCRHASLSIL